METSSNLPKVDPRKQLLLGPVLAKFNALPEKLIRRCSLRNVCLIVFQNSQEKTLVPEYLF